MIHKHITTPERLHSIPKKGRPAWNFSTARDRYLIGAFWARFFVENKLNGDEKVTKHFIAMSYAAIERGKLNDSVARLSQKGKLTFLSKFSEKSALGAVRRHKVKNRADDIRRKAERARKTDPARSLMMASAFAMAFYEQNLDRALGCARAACVALCEEDFFERSLKPFIEGRFDPSKRVVFSLPDFMPNFSNPKP